MSTAPKYLYLRGSTYYYRRVVPYRLRKYVGGWEFSVSLRTSDRETAIIRAKEEHEKALAILKEAEMRFAKGSKSKLPISREKAIKSIPLAVTSESHAQQLTRQWFIILERTGAAWLRDVKPTLSREALIDASMDLQFDEECLTGDNPHEEVYDRAKEVRRFLDHFHFSLASDSAGFRLLKKFLPTARLEFVKRQQDRINGRAARSYDHAFEDLNAFSPDLTITGGVTLGQLNAKFLEEWTKAQRSRKTIAKYRSVGKLLCEVFGESRGIESLKRTDIERFASILESLPSNMTKHYQGLSLMDAIEEAKRRGDEELLKTNTRRGYFYNASTILNYAVQIDAIAKNPFNDSLLKQRFPAKDDEEMSVPYSIEQLQAIFNAPLFVGSLDDRRRYAKPGPNVIRRGRFWVPLIALFQGARLNEICQLHTADVQEWEGGFSLNLREGDDRTLKNKPSRRLVPVHPELLKMGFVQFLASRRTDTESRRLFPELPLASTGSYSDNFSKWFARFLRHVFQRKIEPNFHSFRHTFVTACRAADISPQRIDRLCGWASGGRQQRAYGAADPLEALAENLRRVGFKGLDLSHLYLPSPENAPSTPKVRPKSRQVTV